ncbi:MAG: hypothetical protein RLZZ292_372 [Bacteroidota bacterium]
MLPFNQKIMAQPDELEMYCPEPPAASAQGHFLDSENQPLCSDINTIKYVRVAIHFLLPTHLQNFKIDDICGDKDPQGNYYKIHYIGAGNFTETSDGFLSKTLNGYKRAEDMIALANYELATNSLPRREEKGVTYPATAPFNPLRYVLVGTYFHRDDDAYFGKETNWDIHKKYDIDASNVLDIYEVPYGYNFTSGIASTIGGDKKFVCINDYFKYVYPKCRDWSIQFAAHNLNHEIGHTLNLQHTWNEDDKCVDTPNGFLYNRLEKNPITQLITCEKRNANCWSKKAQTPNLCNNSPEPCDIKEKTSNNIMDYNQYFPHSYTSCQIKRINDNLASPDGSSYVHSCNGCMPCNAFFDVEDEYAVCPRLAQNSAIILNGQGSFNENIYLIEVCEIDNPKSTDCISTNTYNSGWVHGTVDKENLSNVFWFEPNKYYKIKLTVDNTDCPPSSEYTRVIHTIDCPPMDPIASRIQVEVQNPFDTEFSIFYNVEAQGKITMDLVNIITGASTKVLEESNAEIGNHSLMLNTENVNPGTYNLIVKYENSLISKTILKL